jgi:hypothetical protein
LQNRVPRHIHPLPCFSHFSGCCGFERASHF